MSEGTLLEGAGLSTDSAAAGQDVTVAAQDNKAPEGTDAGAAVESQEASERWWNNLPPETHKTLENYKDPLAAAEALYYAKQKIGQLTSQKGMGVPGPDAKPEEVEAFYKALGRPENPDGYEISFDGRPEGLPVNEEFVNGFKSAAHEAGLTPTQVQKLSGWYGQLEAQFVEQQQAQRSEVQVAEFRSFEKAFGPGEPTKQALAQAQKAAKALDASAPGFWDALIRTGAGDQAAVLSALAKIAPMLTESGMASGTPDPMGGMSVEERRAKLVELGRKARAPGRTQADIQAYNEFAAKAFPGTYQSKPIA